MAADIALSAADEFFIYKKIYTKVVLRRAGESLLPDEGGE